MTYMNDTMSAAGSSAPISSGGNHNSLSEDIGAGQYNTQGYNINAAAFSNPVGDQSAQGFGTGQSQLLTAANAQAPQVGAASLSSGAGTTGLTNVANTEMGIANGSVQGAAAKTAALQSAQNQQANLSAMGSARGTANPALAGYNVGQQNAAVQNTAAQNAVTGAAQEQLGALGAAGGAFGNIQQNQQFNAQQSQQVAIQNATLKAQQMGLQGQELQDYVNNNSGQIANSMAAAQAGQQLQVQNNLGQQQINEEAYAASQKAKANLVGSITGAATNAAGAALSSDRRLKKNIKPSKDVLDKFLKNYSKAKISNSQMSRKHSDNLTV